MGDFGYMVLLIFILIRILIAAGLVYLVIIEIRRYKRKRVRGDEGANKDGNTKDIGKSPGG